MKVTITLRRPISVAGHDTVKILYGEAEDRPADREWKITPDYVIMTPVRVVENAAIVGRVYSIDGHRVYVPYANIDGVVFDGKYGS